MKRYLFIPIILLGHLLNGQVMFTNISSTNTSESQFPSNIVKKIIIYESTDTCILFYDQIAIKNTDGWQYYNANNSGITNFPMDFSIDTQGIFWIRDWFTIQRFDGNNWISYTDSLYEVGSKFGSCADQNGSVYFTSSHAGILKFTDTTLTQITNSSGGLLSNTTNCVFMDNQNLLWVGHTGGISVYNGISCTYHYMNNIGGNYINDIVQTTDGRIWVATDHGVASFNGSSWTSYDPFHLIGFTDSEVKFLAADSSGGFWCGTDQKGIFHFDNVNWNFYSVENALATNRLNSLTVLSNNFLWVCTIDMGINIFDGINWTVRNTYDGLSCNEVNAILSFNNELWFGTNAGIVNYNGNSWTSYFYSYSQPLLVACLRPGKNDKLWFGTLYSPYGTGYLSDTIWTTFQGSLVNNILVRPVKDICEVDSGITWFATKKGLNKLLLTDSSSIWELYQASDGLPDNQVLAIIHSNDSLIIGTKNGLCTYNGQTFNSFSLGNIEGIVSNQITSLLYDRNQTLWAGTSNGLASFDGQNWQAYFTQDGLADNYINKVFEASDSSLWLGTMNGISRYKNGMFTSWYKADGLIADKVNDITEDQNQILYFATDYGVSKLALSSLDIETTIKLKSDNLKLYPNPASNKLYFKSHDSGIVKIYSLSGRVLLETHVLPGQNQVDISSLPPGNYFLQAVGNKTSRVGRFVVLR